MFKFSTKLDKNKINKYSNFKMNNTLPLFIIIATVIIILGITFFFENKNILAIIWTLFGIFYTPVIFFAQKISQKIYNSKPESNMIDTDEIYIFNELEFTIQQREVGGFNVKESFKYFDIYKFYETENDYLLFFSKTQTHIIPKTSFIEGSEKLFESFMKDKLGDKYKKRSFKI